MTGQRRTTPGTIRAASARQWVRTSVWYGAAMASTFGALFRVTTWGESHGGGVGVVVDGCPPRIALDTATIQRELDRRRPGQSRITTQRKEEDRVEILSGVFEGHTLGTPISLMVKNKDARPKDYAEVRVKYRPSHADYTYQAKYGIRDWMGGGRASARETVGRGGSRRDCETHSARGRRHRHRCLRQAGPRPRCRRGPERGHAPMTWRPTSSAARTPPAPSA